MNKRIIKKYSVEQIIELIKQKEYSLFEIEELTGINHKKIKDLLITTLGDKVSFKRGRNGGIVIKD